MNSPRSQSFLVPRFFFFRFPNIILEINNHSNEVTEEDEEEVPSPPAPAPLAAIDVHSPLDFSNAPAKRLRESEEEEHPCRLLRSPLQEIEDREETPDQNKAKFQLRKTLAALLHGIDSMPFTREEMLRLMKVWSRHVKKSED